MVRFDYYTEGDHSSQFEEWIRKLPPKDKIKLLATIHNIEQYGLQIALRKEWVKKIDDEIWEIRSRFGNNIQRGPFFFAQGDLCIITHGFTKKTQKTPKSEINRAREIMKRYKENNHAH
ncbi:type II toxin-antitoxin system RelE/ParE family toxin [Bifidobacterium callitrichidarum]|uniref:Addiction module toxin RelE n=1 Tax=Bifidobacterium callitrichidarum TaxID=2052941 RepID=A0A2U2N0S7_9BIFI|nr:type II toxin-antitoxin system RelE/ParE family toxin [Bifidobacterium callitrichidarum]PWG62668.1 addiction module toxin RelE [Bifidobacterium callitrichidarum]